MQLVKSAGRRRQLEQEKEKDARSFLATEEIEVLWRDMVWGSMCQVEKNCWQL